MNAMHIIRHRRLLARLSLLLAADAVVFGGTDAHRVSAVVTIIGFGLLIATVYYLVYGILAIVRLYGVVIKHKQRLAGSLTGLAAFIVALQSVGELNVKDVLLVLPLVVVGYVYTAYGLDRQTPD